MSRNVLPQMKYICGPVGGAVKDRSFSGNAAALMAGRRLADPTAVDQAVMREVRRFEAARERMRSALVPYIVAAS